MDLYELNFDQKLLILVEELQKSMDKIFYDKKSEVYFFSNSSDKSIIVRLQDGMLIIKEAQFFEN